LVDWWAVLQNSSIVLLIGISIPWLLYVGYSEINRLRERREQRADSHRRELKDEAANKLQNVYGPLLYRLDVAANNYTRRQSRTDECRYVLSYDEIDEISSILAANHHLIAEDILNSWEQRYDGARWTQWTLNEGTGAPADLAVGYAMNLSRMWQRTKSVYDQLMRQYQNNRD
jgi:hypothetical protein